MPEKTLAERSVDESVVRSQVVCQNLSVLNCEGRTRDLGTQTQDGIDSIEKVVSQRRSVSLKVTHEYSLWNIFGSNLNRPKQHRQTQTHTTLKLSK